MERPSPACILSFLITAGLRGELREAWSWSDGPEDDPKGSVRPGAEQDTKAEAAGVILNGNGKQEMSARSNSKASEHDS